MGWGALGFLLLIMSLCMVVMWGLGYAAGMSVCQGTGNAHVDAFLAYLRLHVGHRKAALEVSKLFASVGVPLQITSPGEVLALSSAASVVLASIAGFGKHCFISAGPLLQHFFEAERC